MDHGLESVSGAAGYKDAPKNDEVGMISKALNGKYKIRFNDSDYYTYTTDALDYTGTKIEHNAPQIKKVSEYSSEYDETVENLKK